MPSSYEMKAAVAPPSSARDPLIGMQVDGRYVIERVQGRGGTSIVYAGIHEELQSEVAIKVLDPSSAADPAAVERFGLEARLGSSLAHGNVVGVSDIGRLPDGRPYLVMPMIAGVDMATLLAQEGPQDPRRVARLLQGVASALGLMQARGLVHRDIKSENLMYVVHDDGTETALVLDFGIAAAQVFEASARADSSGTPEFMPPEAWSGELVDYRGDIYALATVAFELITGTLPFEAEDLPDLRHKKTTQPARTLAQASGREFPAALEAVIARSLAQRPEQRHASASEFISELQAAAELMPEWSQRRAPSHRASLHPTLAGTGSGVRERASAGVPIQSSTKTIVGRRAPLRMNPLPSITRAKTLKGVSAHALNFASFTPTTLGARAPLPLPAPARLPARRAALVQHADAPAPQPKALDGGPPAVSHRAAGASLPPHAKPALASEPDPDLDSIGDAFLPRWNIGRLLAYAALAAVFVLLLVLWPRTRPAPRPAAPPRSAVTAPLPAQIKPALPIEPTVAAAPAAPAPSAVAAPAAGPLGRTALDAHAAPAVGASAGATARAIGASAGATARAVGEAPHVAAASHTPGSASAKRKKPAVLPSAQLAKHSETGSRLGAALPASKPSGSPARGKSDPERAHALAERATDAMLRSDFGAAVGLYQQAIAADSGYAPAWRGKALALERMGRPGDAATAFRQFLKLAPNGPVADKIRQRLRALEGAR